MFMSCSGYVCNIDFYCLMFWRESQPCLVLIHGIGIAAYMMSSLLSLFPCRYFSQGAPVVLFTLLPSFVIGGLTVTNHKALYFISLLYIIVHRLAYNIKSYLY